MLKYLVRGARQIPLEYNKKGGKVMKKLFLIAKVIIGALTVLTIFVIFLQVSPSIMDWKVVREYTLLPYIFLVVVFFWSIYLVWWAMRR